MGTGIMVMAMVATTMEAVTPMAVEMTAVATAIMVAGVVMVVPLMVDMVERGPLGTVAVTVEAAVQAVVALVAELVLVVAEATASEPRRTRQ